MAIIEVGLCYMMNVNFWGGAKEIKPEKMQDVIIECLEHPALSRESEVSQLAFSRVN